MKIEVDAASEWLSFIQRFLETFGWLGDSFVLVGEEEEHVMLNKMFFLNFYNERHWEKLPCSWRDFLPKMSPSCLAQFLDLEGDAEKEVEGFRIEGEIPPLSLLAFKKTVNVLSFPRRFERDMVYKEISGCGRGRRRQGDDENDVKAKAKKEFKNLFTRHVKLKKRHEVEELGELISILSLKTSATHIYDIGSGLGHLSRYLSYACGLTLMCVDREESFGESATRFDRELTSFLEKKKSFDKFPQPPSHVCINLELNKPEQTFQSQPFLFGFTGLHACGNLTPVIVHNFVNSPAAFLVSLGCCYMKLNEMGFPLSKTANRIGLKFTYESLEVSCHALEQYCDRLRQGHVRKLMTHSYRAALETILTKRGIRRAGLRGVPHTERLSFEEYTQAATRNLPNISISASEMSSPEIRTHLNDWFKVVLFYSLRLLIANVVETSVLLDRALFIKESDPSIDVHVLPIFDPLISARNLAVICWRGE